MVSKTHHSGQSSRGHCTAYTRPSAEEGIALGPISKPPEQLSLIGSHSFALLDADTSGHTS